MKAKRSAMWCIKLGICVFAACAKRRPPSPDIAVAAVEPAPPPPTLAAEDDDATAGAAWTLEVAEKGTLRVNFRGAQVMSFHYLFWSPNFSWTNPVVKGMRTSADVT